MADDKLTEYDRLEWGGDDGTSSSAHFANDKYIVYSFADEWMVCTNDSAEDLVEQGEDEDSLKESVNRIAARINLMINRKLTGTKAHLERLQ